LASLNSRDETDRVRLTSWLVEQRRLGISCPNILSTTLDEATKRRAPSVHERADSVLSFIVNSTPRIGEPFAFSKRSLNETANSWQQSPILLGLLAQSDSAIASELEYLLDHLARQGFIHQLTYLPGSQSQGPHRGHEDYFEYLVTPQGHTRIAELAQRTSVSLQAFVAMWFDESMDAAYEEGFAPAIRDAGFEPLRIDGKQHNNKIDDEIIAEIRRSRFVVADFTQGTSGARGGVYYEAGFAHGHNIPVIFTCSADAIDKVHFDTRQYNHIAWKDHGDLRVRLANRISATIGDGPMKVPS